MSVDVVFTRYMVKYEMLSLAVKYGLNDVREGLSTIKDSVWSCFVQKVQL